MRQNSADSVVARVCVEHERHTEVGQNEHGVACDSAAEVLVGLFSLVIPLEDDLRVLLCGVVPFEQFVEWRRALGEADNVLAQRAGEAKERL